jgi:hypothetical protein
VASRIVELAFLNGTRFECTASYRFIHGYVSCLSSAPPRRYPVVQIRFREHSSRAFWGFLKIRLNSVHILYLTSDQLPGGLHLGRVDMDVPLICVHTSPLPPPRVANTPPIQLRNASSTATSTWKGLVFNVLGSASITEPIAFPVKGNLLT